MKKIIHLQNNKSIGKLSTKELACISHAQEKKKRKLKGGKDSEIKCMAVASPSKCKNL